MSPWYVRLLARLLRSKDPTSRILKIRPDVIFAASYSAKNHRKLAWATAQNFGRAMWFQDRIKPAPPIVFGSCSHPFSGAALAESRLKAKMFRGGWYIDAGPITNSITEMLAARDALAREGIFPKRLLIVTCELHSWSERMLAKMVFPKAEIFVVCNTHEIEVEDDHPTKDQRSWPRWSVASLARFTALVSVSVMPATFQGRALDMLAGVKHG